MSVRVYKPKTPGTRKSSVQDFSDLTRKKPQKSLVKSKKKASGRNSTGRITIRHRGGGSKKKIRIIDYKRDKFDIPAKVSSIEYDPARGARIALLNYRDGEKRYIIAPNNIRLGAEIISSQKKIDIEHGNSMPLEFIPPGIVVHNIELHQGRGAQIARGAGVSVTLMGVEGKFAQLKMPSGEIRLVPKECMAVVGQVSNPDYRLVRWGKAGRMRNRGIRPTVRGKAMNPVDHPHGGGEGGAPIGMKHPKTPWGKPALGVKTRRRRPSDKLILKGRKKKRKK